MRVKEQLNTVRNQIPQEVIKALILAADKWLDGRAQNDDISFVVLRYK